MIDLLHEWRIRSIPPYEPFHTGNGLSDKVCGEKLLPYAGNTVVFTLDDSTKESLTVLQNELYACGGAFLAEPLPPNTFHVTLHDLVHDRPEALSEAFDSVGRKARSLLSALRKEPSVSVHVEATCAFNMAHTSIVLGLRPSGAVDWVHLDGLFGLFQTIPETRQNHGYTPHVTLGYFRPGTYDPESMKDLSEFLGKPVDLRFTLSTEDLVYQTFTSMNDYVTEY